MRIPETDWGICCDARRACTRPAVFILAIHRVHDCRGADLTPDGDAVFLVCPVDAAGAAWRLGVMVGEMYAEMPDEDTAETVACCSTCGRAIRDVEDVMGVQNLDQSPIRGGR